MGSYNIIAFVCSKCAQNQHPLSINGRCGTVGQSVGCTVGMLIRDQEHTSILYTTTSQESHSMQNRVKNEGKHGQNFSRTTRVGGGVEQSRVADARERHANYKSLNAISLHNSNVSVLSQIEFVSHHIKTRFTSQSQEVEMRITAEPQQTAFYQCKSSHGTQFTSPTSIPTPRPKQNVSQRQYIGLH